MSPCAKLWPAWSIIFQVRATGIYTRIGLRSQRLFLKWVSRMAVMLMAENIFKYVNREWFITRQLPIYSSFVHASVWQYENVRKIIIMIKRRPPIELPKIITVTSLWARWRLKSPAPPLFTHPLIVAQIKANTKAPSHWLLCGEFTGDRWIPRTNGQ